MVESVLGTFFSVFHCKVFFALLEDYYQLAMDFGKLGLIVCVCVCVRAHALSHVHLFVTPWTAVCQVPLSMGFSRQEHWSELPFHSPGHLPDPGIEPVSPASPALAGGFFTTEPPGKPSPPNLLFID